METVSDSQTPKLAKRLQLKMMGKDSCVLGVQKKRLIQTILLSTHNMNKEISFPIHTLIWRPTHLFEMPFICLFSDIICWKSNAAIRQHLGAVELRAKLR